MEKLLMGEENYNEGGAGFSSIIWKDNEKTTNKNYYAYEGFTSSLYLTLYAKVFLVISTIYSTAFVIQRSFLRNWDQNLRFSVKSEVSTRVEPPHTRNKNIRM